MSHWGAFVRKVLTFGIIIWIALFWRSTSYLFWLAIVMAVCGAWVPRTRKFIVLLPFVTVVVAIILYCVGTESALYYMWPALSATVVCGVCSALLLIGTHGEVAA